MEKFIIEGGTPLSGTLVPAGNKNAALPALAASLLTREQVVLRNVPRIRDVEAMLQLLERLGVKAEWREDNTLVLQVLVTPLSNEARRDDAPGARQRMPGDASLVSVKTRKAQ